jgi:hypothetical protein
MRQSNKKAKSQNKKGRLPMADKAEMEINVGMVMEQIDRLTELLGEGPVSEDFRATIASAPKSILPILFRAQELIVEEAEQAGPEGIDWHGVYDRVLPQLRLQVFLLDGDRTEVTIVEAPKGHYEPRRIGRRWSIADSSLLGPEVNEAFSAQAGLQRQLHGWQRQIRNLRIEIKQERGQANRLELDLKHLLWTSPTDAFYGVEDLDVVEDRGQLCLVHRGQTMTVLGEEGQQAMEMKSEISRLRTSVEQKEKEAAKIELKLRHEPERLRQLKADFEQVLGTHCQELNELIQAECLILSDDGAGNIVMLKLEEVDEPAELSEYDRDALAVEIKHGQISLPPQALEDLGLSLSALDAQPETHNNPLLGREAMTGLGGICRDQIVVELKSEGGHPADESPTVETTVAGMPKSGISEDDK